MTSEQADILVYIKDIRYMLIFLTSEITCYISSKSMDMTDNFALKIFYAFIPLIWVIFLGTLFWSELYK